MATRSPSATARASSCGHRLGVLGRPLLAFACGGGLNARRAEGVQQLGQQLAFPRATASARSPSAPHRSRSAAPGRRVAGPLAVSAVSRCRPGTGGPRSPAPGRAPTVADAARGVFAGRSRPAAAIAPAAGDGRAVAASARRRSRAARRWPAIAGAWRQRRRCPRCAANRPAVRRAGRRSSRAADARRAASGDLQVLQELPDRRVRFPQPFGLRLQDPAAADRDRRRFTPHDERLVPDAHGGGLQMQLRESGGTGHQAIAVEQHQRGEQLGGPQMHPDTRAALQRSAQRRQQRQGHGDATAGDQMSRRSQLLAPADRFMVDAGQIHRRPLPAMDFLDRPVVIL